MSDTAMRDAMVRMATDPDFARRIREDGPAVAREYGLSEAELTTLQALGQTDSSEGPAQMAQRLSKSGLFGVGTLAAVSDFGAAAMHAGPGGDMPGLLCDGRSFVCYEHSLQCDGHSLLCHGHEHAGHQLADAGQPAMQSHIALPDGDVHHTAAADLGDVRTAAGIKCNGVHTAAGIKCDAVVTGGIKCGLHTAAGIKCDAVVTGGIKCGAVVTGGIKCGLHTAAGIKCDAVVTASGINCDAHVASGIKCNLHVANVTDSGHENAGIQCDSHSASPTDDAALLPPVVGLTSEHSLLNAPAGAEGTQTQ